jgi:hypothetical protein
MIQRIQSVYLLISTISMTLVSFKILVYEIGAIKYFASDDIKLFVLTIVIMFLSLLALVMFKSRLLQIKFIRLALVLNLVIFIRLILLNIQFGAQLSVSALLFIIFSFVALIMAFRGILKDEELIRSSERIR